MRIKLNGTKSIPQFSNETNLLYRRFSKIFDFISKSRNPFRGHNNSSQGYVDSMQLKDLENRILQLSNSEYPQCRALIGNIGIGKSTLLIHAFGALDPQLMDSNTALLLPMTFNSQRIIDIQALTARIAGRIAVATDIVASNYSIPISEELLVSFIKYNRPELLEGVKNIRESTSDIDKLLALRDQDQVSYQIERLKFVCLSSKINRITVVADDIEALDDTFLIRLVKDVLSFQECFRNQKAQWLGINDIPKISLSILISIRPTTYDYLLELNVINVHEFDPPIQFTKPISLSELFAKRFDDALSDSKIAHMAEAKDWEKAKEALFGIVNRLDRRYGEIVVDSCNHSLSNSLVQFQGILQNGRYFQKSKNQNPIIKIDELDFAVNDAGALKAFLIPCGSIFFDSLSPLPNPLHNSFDQKCDLVLPYLFRFIALRSKGSSFSICNMNDLYDSLKSNNLFQDISQNAFLSSLEYGLSNKIFFNASSNDSHLISPAPKLFSILELLKHSIIYLSCIREDTFRDFQSGFSCKQLTEDAPYDRIFCDCCQFVSDIADAEKKHIIYSANNHSLDQFLILFGSEPFSRILLYGINETWTDYYRDESRISNEIRNALDLVKTHVSDLERLIQNAA